MLFCKLKPTNMQPNSQSRKSVSSNRPLPASLEKRIIESLKKSSSQTFLQEDSIVEKDDMIDMQEDGATTLLKKYSDMLKQHPTFNPMKGEDGWIPWISKYPPFTSGDPNPEYKLYPDGTDLQVSA